MTAVPIRAWLPALAAALALATALLGATAGGAAVPKPRLTLDGAPLRPELALTSAARARGLMHRLRAPADGMLFVFRNPTRGGFWMKNTLVPLTIVFFDAEGRRIRKLRMAPCRKDPCPLYGPRRTYRFALELRGNDPRPARRLGPLRELRRLIGRAE